MKAKVWVLSSQPVGEPKLENFKCIEEEIPSCSDGEIAIEAEALSVDPYMRYRIRMTEIGQPIFGSQVGRVVESKDGRFPVGSYIVAYVGWRTHTKISHDELKEGLSGGRIYPLNIGDMPKTLGLGALGMPGNTAYFGFLEICKPKSGDTVLVSGAAGAVGSLVCQIAKIKGCNVIAFAGTDEKLNWLKELGCDYVFNYKKTTVDEALNTAAPDGINCYFDNVGGKFSAKVMNHMADFSRISVCGAISNYNNEDFKMDEPNGCFNEFALIKKQIKVEGFLVYQWASRAMEGIVQMKKWIEQGKIKYKETIFEGFESMPRAFIGLFHGDNIGKAVIKIK